MTNDEYLTHIGLLVGQARIIDMVPVREMLRAIDDIESIGFIFAKPMEWTAGLDNLDDAKDLLNAYAGVQSAVARIKERAIKRGKLRADDGMRDWMDGPA